MKKKYKLSKWLLLGVVALAAMAIVLPGCDQEVVAPSEEETAGGVSPTEEASAGGVSPTEEASAGGVSPTEEASTGGVSPPEEASAGGASTSEETSTGGVSSTEEVPAGGTTPLPSPEVATVDIALEVDSTNSEGVRFVAPETGSYTLTFIEGAYNYWETDDPAVGFLGWRTRIDLYINRPVDWGGRDEWGPHPTNSDDGVGPIEYSPTWEDAEAAGQGSSVSVLLNKNDYVIMIVSDASDYYYDNSGTVKIRITGP